MFAFHNTPCYGVKKQAQNPEALIYNGLQQLFLLISELPQNVKNEQNREQVRKREFVITRRVTNFFIFYFLHKSLTEFMVADVFEFVVSRRALTKNIAQKLEALDIIHFQAMQSKTINNIKK